MLAMDVSSSKREVQDQCADSCSHMAVSVVFECGTVLSIFIGSMIPSPVRSHLRHRSHPHLDLILTNEMAQLGRAGGLCTSAPQEMSKQAHPFSTGSEQAKLSFTVQPAPLLTFFCARHGSQFSLPVSHS